jgi:uncharacterized coiled-coil protein SlyX
MAIGVEVSTNHQNQTQKSRDTATPPNRPSKVSKQEAMITNLSTTLVHTSPALQQAFKLANKMRRLLNPWLDLYHLKRKEHKYMHFIQEVQMAPHKVLLGQP